MPFQTQTLNLKLSSSLMARRWWWLQKKRAGLWPIRLFSRFSSTNITFYDKTTGLPLLSILSRVIRTTSKLHSTSNRKTHTRVGPLDSLGIRRVVFHAECSLFPYSIFAFEVDRQVLETSRFVRFHGL